MADDKMQEILRRLEDGVKSVFESERYKSYLKTMSKLHSYSINNCMWLFFQKPDASTVAGFNTWKNLGRHVKKGEKALSVIAPCPYKKRLERDSINPITKRPVLDSAGKHKKEVVEVTKQAFKAVPVFDISQTEGKPLTQLTYELEGNVEHYNKMMLALEQLSPVPISFETMEDTKGYYHLVDKRIAIKEGMSQLHTVKTAIHETVHAILHDATLTPDGKVSKEEGVPQKDRATKEVEAESVAFIVCQHYEIDTSDYSFSYLAGWSANKEIPELKKSLETIRTTANQCITVIDNHFAIEMIQEQAKEDVPTIEQMPIPPVEPMSY